MYTQALTSPACDAAPERLIRCVSSGYLSDGCSCQATVPSHVATAAWARELESTGAREGQFFSFGWRGGEWLGYGLGDGHVRGVYCPEHNARRAETSCGGRLSLAS
jgi:hypothetical protein